MRNCKRISVVFLAAALFLVLQCKAEDAFVYPKDLERDPFDPLVNAQGILNARLIQQVGDLQLNGILYSDNAGERNVIINNMMLKEGDAIGSYQVEEINPTQVILDKKGKKITLNMKEE